MESSAAASRVCVICTSDKQRWGFLSLKQQKIKQKSARKSVLLNTYLMFIKINLKSRELKHWHKRCIKKITL